MGIFKRIGDIISANLNELAEQYEDPEKMLKQRSGRWTSQLRTRLRRRHDDR